MVGKSGPMVFGFFIIFLLLTATVNPDVSVGLLVLFLAGLLVHRMRHSHRAP
jgi:hypothetical protein